MPYAANWIETKSATKHRNAAMRSDGGRTNISHAATTPKTKAVNSRQRRTMLILVPAERILGCAWSAFCSKRAATITSISIPQSAQLDGVDV
jgi:hypothetical protein